jgi:hypothetical protein
MPGSAAEQAVEAVDRPQTAARSLTARRSTDDRARTNFCRYLLFDGAACGAGANRGAGLR